MDLNFFSPRSQLRSCFFKMPFILLSIAPCSPYHQPSLNYISHMFYSYSPSHSLCLQSPCSPGLPFIWARCIWPVAYLYSLQSLLHKASLASCLFWSPPLIQNLLDQVSFLFLVSLMENTDHFLPENVLWSLTNLLFKFKITEMYFDP